jgi:multiple sugar transport system substrate-binding protein
VGITAIERMPWAQDALLALLPIGLDHRNGEFDKLFMDTFDLIVLRGQKPRPIHLPVRVRMTQMRR